MQTAFVHWDCWSREALPRQGIYALISRPQIVKIESRQGNPLWAALHSVKNRAHDAIARLVPEPEASLLQGTLLGIRSSIPAYLYDDYNAPGTSHIIVISESNGVPVTIGTFGVGRACSAYLGWTSVFGHDTTHDNIRAGKIFQVLTRPFDKNRSLGHNVSAIRVLF